MIAIETGVPVPTHRGRGAVPVYPFGDMRVGHSFAAAVKADSPDPQVSQHKAAQRVRCAAANWKRRMNRRDVTFQVLFVEEEGVVRCWRTA
jgi:hypothetical protein